MCTCMSFVLHPKLMHKMNQGGGVEYPRIPIMERSQSRAIA
jgi:hypothetical protein